MSDNIKLLKPTIRHSHPLPAGFGELWEDGFELPSQALFCHTTTSITYHVYNEGQHHVCFLEETIWKVGAFTHVCNVQLVFRLQNVQKTPNSWRMIGEAVEVQPVSVFEPLFVMPSSVAFWNRYNNSDSSDMLYDLVHLKHMLNTLTPLQINL